MIKSNKVLLPLLTAVIFSGCATSGLTNAQKETGIGAGLGAAAGAVIAHATGGSALTGAAIGAAAGGAIGYYHGRSVDIEEAEKLKKASESAGQSSTITMQTVIDPTSHEKVKAFKSQEIKIKNSDLTINNPKVDELLNLTEAIASKLTVEKIEITGNSNLINTKVLPNLSDVDQKKIKVNNQKTAVVTIKLTAVKLEGNKG